MAMQQTGNPERDGGGEDPRVRFAAERTLLAWVRTGLALMGFGFVVARFGLFLRRIAMIQQEVPAHSYGWSLGLGTGLVSLGIAVVLLAGAEHWRILRRLRSGESYIAPRWSLGLAVSMLIAVLGAAMIAYLLLVSS